MAALALFGCVHTGDPPRMPPAAVTYMVDTLSPEHREVLDLWRAYLSSRPQEMKARPQWSAAEQTRWPIFDLAAGFAYPSEEAYQKTHATIFQIAPARPGDSTEYVVRTYLTRSNPGSSDHRVIIMRVYAARENGHWVLGNALPRMTAGWDSTQVGPIKYMHVPGYRVDTSRARLAVRFVDSLATAFHAPKPAAVTYYLASSPEEVFRINGIELYLPGSRAFTLVGNYMVFSGVPTIGEFFPHELTHMVLGWVLPSYNAPAAVDEAMALWLGGGREMTWPQLKHELKVELERRPSLTMEKLLEDRPENFPHRFTAIAMLLELANARGGLPALTAAIKASRDGNQVDMVGGVAEALDMKRSDVAAAWREVLTRAR